MFLTLEFLHNLVGLFRHLLIHILTLFIVLVDVAGLCQCLLKVTLHQQIHRFRTVLHTSGGVDAWPDLKHDITHRNLTPSQTADVDNRLQTHRRTRCQLLQTVEGQDAVLTHDGYDVCRDTHCTQIE